MRYPCIDPAFESQFEAEDYGRNVYRCIEGHFHVESAHESSEPSPKGV